MPFVELYAPKGAFASERGQAALRSLVSEVMVAEGAPDNEAARSISWLVLHEPDAWFVGGAEVTDAEPPRYVARVSVPAGSLNDAKRADMVQRVTRVLAGAEEDSERLFRQPHAWVHIHEVPEGNWGAFGRQVGLADIVSLVAAGTPVPA